MTKNKLAIIGGSGLYEIEGLENPKWNKIKTPWGNPSDQILSFKYKGKNVNFLPRHARGHIISPSNINFRANIDALKQLGVTDIISVSAVGSLKENLDPGTLYHCIYQNKIMLVYKDHNEILNCYEIGDAEIVSSVKISNKDDIEKILEEYIEKKNLRKK